MGAAKKSFSRKLTTRAKRRQRAKKGLVERRAQRIADEAKCYDMARLEPHIDRQPDGCWIWRGPYQTVFGQPRPLVRAGEQGKQRADQVMHYLVTRELLPHGCFLAKTCGKVECVAPEHMVVSNRSVENAKRRLAYVQETPRQRTGS